MKMNILKKFAIAIASTSLALTAPVMSDAFAPVQTVEAATMKIPSTVKLNKISRTHRRKSIRSTISSLSKIYIEDKFSSPKDKPIVLPNPKKKPKKRKNKRIKGLVIKNKRD